ncbi:hypothetical protein G9C98_001721 [Cotesia typhae]|uniref:Arrestin C-terminal-like domain-containing protein n=1 Tax=Cotesia typhae TaxID=2053667 RepID=A0A8J5QQ36_9HYME|nr:hypothetical protein G9C98_001721 [Cotesia typhae]
MDKSNTESPSIAVRNRIGVDRFEVLLDDEQNIYYCGKIVTGKLPISENIAKTFMGHAEPLTVSIFLPVRGYVPGQTIPLKVNFENSSNIDVKKLRVVLKKVVLYRSMESVRKHKEIVVEIEQIIDKNNCVYNEEFVVPAIPPSGTVCNLIDVEYKLKVEAFADINEWYYKMFYKNLKIRMDIIIGTVPLKNYEDPVDLNEDLKNDEKVTSDDQVDLNIKGAVYTDHQNPIKMKQMMKKTKKLKNFLQCTAFMSSKII